MERAEAVHGKRYDYSLVEYRGTHENVSIICSEHGEFQQSPANHYKGKGCSDCGGSKPHTTESFIKAAKAVHGDRYNYAQVEYRTNKAHIRIICPDHGAFSQIAAVHLRGNGCPECGGNKKHTKDSFVERARGGVGRQRSQLRIDMASQATGVVVCQSGHTCAPAWCLLLEACNASDRGRCGLGLAHRFH